MIGHRLTESMILRRAQKENLEHVKRVNLWYVLTGFYFLFRGLRICDASLLQYVPTLEVVSLRLLSFLIVFLILTHFLTSVPITFQVSKPFLSA